MSHGLHRLSLWATTLAALLVGGVVSADDPSVNITATIHMHPDQLHSWVERSCEWFRVCTPGTDAERAQQVATFFHGTVEITPHVD